MQYTFAADPAFFFLLIPALLIGVPLVLWIGFASTLARRDAMDRPNRIAQWYGYSVCLVGVVVALASTPAVVNSLYTLANPLYSELDFGPSLSSFQAYRATYQDAPPINPATGEGMNRTQLPDAELRLQYQALRDDRMRRNRSIALRSLVSSGLVMLLAMALFAFHWRWLRRLPGEAATPG